MIKFFSLLLISLMIACTPSKGEFGWAVTNDSDKDILEREIYSITDYKMTRQSLVFLPSDTIHFIYTFDSKPASDVEFIVTLEKETLGFVEIDLKKQLIEPETSSLKGKFSNLEIGKYRIQIVYDQDVIDQIVFEILPDEGHYVKGDLDDSKEQDDIIKFSR